MEQAVVGINTLLDGSLSQVSEGRSGMDDDSSLASSSMFSSSRRSNTGGGSSTDQEEAHVRRERYMMGRARLVVVSGLLALAAVAAYVWYRFDRQNQQDIYRVQFTNAANQSIQHFLNTLQYQLETTMAVATSIATSCSTSTTTGTTSSSPIFCGLSRFERRMAGPRRLAGATAVWWGPILQQQQDELLRAEWEQYAIDHAYYLQNNFTDPVKKKKKKNGIEDESPYRRITNDWKVPQDGIFQFEKSKTNDKDSIAVSRDDSSSSFLAPIWQSSPASVTALSLPMFDQASEPMRKNALQDMMSFQVPVFSESQYQGEPDVESAPSDTPLSLVNSYSGNNDIDKRLHVSLYTPIYTAPNNDDNDASNNGNTIMGALTMDLDWSNMLTTATATTTTTTTTTSGDSSSSSAMTTATTAIQEASKAPLWIVLENTVGQRFVFESYPDTLSLLPDEKGFKMFKNELGLQVSSSYQDFANLFGFNNNNNNNNNDMDQHPCYYRITIYPTMEYENVFLTNQPILTGLGVGGIVLAVIAVFALYDFVVEKRQARVVASAKRSNAIVKSLFPAGVRNRLMDNAAARTGNGGIIAKEDRAKLESLLPKNFLPLQTQKARLQSFLTTDSFVESMNDNGKNSHTIGGNGGDKSNWNGGGGAGGNNRMGGMMVPSGTSSTGAGRRRSHGPSSILGSEPIADFFPATTILFADLAGFTAWSSSREPSQVFTLLETLYGAMDKTARRLGVFKVETVGDCYVAATGIPDPRDDHAMLMVRFARSSLEKIEELTDSLESALGPGTGDLAMRVGIHSGPVTAGVLRGEKSRFQLFGDTMNTASRMESTGMKRRIHISKDTADLLIEAGSGHWLEVRSDSVMAKGKGQLVTYWLKDGYAGGGRRLSSSARSNHQEYDPESTETSHSSNYDETGAAVAHATAVGQASAAHANKMSGPSKMNSNSAATAISGGSGPGGAGTTNNGATGRRQRQRRTSASMSDEGPYGLHRLDRLVDYNVEVLFGLLKKIVARRNLVLRDADHMDVKETENSLHGRIALDEIKECIEMPEFNAEAAVMMASDATVEIPDNIKNELRNYIHRIANSYNLNPFHNFEHASHVALSVNKLMKRIVMPDDVDYRRNSKQRDIDKVIAVSKDLHKATLGISSDPVTQFACVFVALIHDAGHTGVPNFVVAKEEPNLAMKYRNKSLAEQRSIDIAWNILMEDSYESLRNYMFPSVSELKHFRELIVNNVMATDIFDKELSALRKARWQKCFHPEESFNFSVESIAAAAAASATSMLLMDSTPKKKESKNDVFNRKATIVIEHIIQASDVAHTMQHWHVYQKWNERLFMEMYDAYKSGRQDKDPSQGWYKGELWFFDNYVIPLAKKLDECGVFGVSSAEYLNYAVENRNEWERKGESIVGEFLDKVKDEDDDEEEDDRIDEADQNQQQQQQQQEDPQPEVLRSD